jgi:GSCFA family
VTDHPYMNLPSHCFWRRIHNVESIDEVDPVVAVPFRIGKSEGIATAGSCFAQHIARHLSASGYNYMVTEEAHPLVPPEVAREHNYGVFTARYGNLYTARQLLQLFKRAYGLFHPLDNVWVNKEGRFLDPYRPTIEPKGFGSRREFEIDRERHFAAVREAFEESNVFIFTFGLTETYINAQGGAVYPVCPGVAGGEFNPQRHVFKNFTLQEITADFLEFVDLMRSRNTQVRFIITVSPVPLVATAERAKSVINSTVYSKSVLRVACEEISKARNEVVYFPSFEIVTGNYARGRYFAEDLRSVTEAGVAHVMKIFMKHFTEPNAGKSFFAKWRRREAAPLDVEEFKEVERALDLICEEELLDTRPSRKGWT